MRIHILFCLDLRMETITIYYEMSENCFFGSITESDFMKTWILNNFT